MTETLFRGLIQESDPHEPFYQAYWAYAEHLGAALEMMRAAAIGNGLQRPIWRLADPWEWDDPHEAEHVVAAPNGKVLWDETVYSFPPEEDPFELPYGIIGCSGEGRRGGHDTLDIRSGFRVTKKKKKDSLITVEANVDASELSNVYFSLLREYGEFEVFLYKLHDPYGDGEKPGENAVFVNKALSTAGAIINHIETEAANGLMNGFVTLTAYVSEGETNINISPHKKIVVMTYSDQEAKRVIGFLMQRGYEELKKFITVSERVCHIHFRPPESLEHRQLIERLLQEGFSRWVPDQT